jgi:single stranded DNA-binding protein
VRGIEAATWGSAIKDGEVRQSKAGNDFGTVSLAVSEGKSDDSGREISTFVKVILFGKLAQEAAKIAKGDRCYVEGNLSATAYQHETGPRVDLTIRAFKFERSGIGKNRVFREKGHELPQSAFKADARKEAEAVFKHDKQNQGRSQAEHQLRATDFDDALPF